MFITFKLKDDCLSVPRQVTSSYHHCQRLKSWSAENNLIGMLACIFFEDSREHRWCRLSLKQLISACHVGIYVPSTRLMPTGPFLQAKCEYSKEGLFILLSNSPVSAPSWFLTETWEVLRCFPRGSSQDWSFRRWSHWTCIIYIYIHIYILYVHCTLVYTLYMYIYIIYIYISYIL